MGGWQIAYAPIVFADLSREYPFARHGRTVIRFNPQRPKVEGLKRREPREGRGPRRARERVTKYTRVSSGGNFRQDLLVLSSL